MAGTNQINVQTCTLNVRGLRDHFKRRTLFKWLIELKLDIIFLQETHVTENFIATFNKDWPGKVYHCCSDSAHSKGVAILIKNTVDFSFINMHKDNDGRKIILNCDIENNSFSLVCAYAPNDGKTRLEFLKRLGKWIKQYCRYEKKIICGADLNTVDRNIDRSTGNLDRTSAQFTHFKSFTDLTDIFRKMNGNNVEYSFIDPSGNGIKSRIDYIMTSKFLADHTMKTKVILAPVPDHKVVFAHFQVNVKQRGRGYWKLNSQFLKSSIYKENVHKIIRNTQAELIGFSPSDIWEMCKLRIKEYSIKFGISRKQLDNQYYKHLEREINLIDQPSNDQISQKKDIGIKRHFLKNELID